jgi:hypothetical protein
MNSVRRSARVTRREAASILKTSYENVKRLQRAKQLVSSPDKNGVHRFSRVEVEELARRRGFGIKPGGELAAKVFAMFKSGKDWRDIVIETSQEPETIRELWRQYHGGVDGKAPAGDAESERVEREEHERQMAEMDREIERRRRAARDDDKDTGT